MGTHSIESRALKETYEDIVAGLYQYKHCQVPICHSLSLNT